MTALGATREMVCGVCPFVATLVISSIYKHTLSLREEEVHRLAAILAISERILGESFLSRSRPIIVASGIASLPRYVFPFYTPSIKTSRRNLRDTR